MFLKLFITISLFYALFRFCEWQTDGFSLLRITERGPPIEIQDGELGDPLHIKNIFTQPFNYLGKGAQTYVFVSADGRYVLKFFRHLNKYGTLLDFLPFAPIQKTVEKRKRRQEKDFTSYKLAFKELQKETGLVYLHLNPTTHLKTEVILYDKIRVQYKLPLDKMGFIVQKRAAPFYPTLERWIEKGQIEEAKAALKELVRLLGLKQLKGIFDKDPNLRTNFGFLDLNPIQIDVGRFRPDKRGKKIRSIVAPLEKWLDERAPELATYLEDEIHQTNP